MPELVFVEESLKNKLMKWGDQDSVCYGLLVGQASKRHYLIVHVMKTDLNNFNGPFREISENAVSEHSLAVTKMLPGGFWVLGIFIVTCEEIWNTEWNYNKSKIIMRKVWDQMMLNSLYRGVTSSNDLILLHFNPIRQKSLAWKYIYNSRYFDVTQLDTQYKLLRNLFLKGSYSWSASDPYKELNIDDLKYNQQKYWKYIHKFEALVASSTILLNGQKVHDKYNQIYKFIQNPPVNNDDQSEQEDDIGKQAFNCFVCLFKPIYQYTLKQNQIGEVHNESIFVYRYLIIQDVFQAIKDDLIRSWASRLYSHIDRLIECDGKKKGPMKKISVLLEHTEVPLYLYIFDSEPLCVKRLQDIIKKNLSIGKDDNYLVFDIEKESDLNKSWEEDENKNEETDHNLMYVIIFISLIVFYTLLVYHGVLINKYTE